MYNITLLAWTKKWDASTERFAMEKSDVFPRGVEISSTKSLTKRHVNKTFLGLYTALINTISRILLWSVVRANMIISKWPLLSPSTIYNCRKFRTAEYKALALPDKTLGITFFFFYGILFHQYDQLNEAKKIKIIRTDLNSRCNSPNKNLKFKKKICDRKTHFEHLFF